MIPHVRAGEPMKFSATAYNAFADAAAKIARIRERQNPPVKSARNDEIVKIKNESGADIVAFSMLEIIGSLNDPDTYEADFRKRVVLRGATPDGDTGTRFVIALEPIEYGEFGDARVSGVFPCKVSVTDSAHNFCGYAAGSAGLVSAVSGPVEILWKQTGLGVKWAVVRIGSSATGTSTPIYVIPAGTGSTAETTAWDISAQPAGYFGAHVAAYYRVYTASDGTTYSFTRETKTDSLGNLIYVGPEVRSTLSISGGLVLHKVLSVSGSTATARKLNADGTTTGDVGTYRIV
jgi:hypothetical protein